MTPIAVHPDPANPRGGFAVLGLPKQGDGPVQITILDRYSRRYLGPSGWQAGPAQLGPIVWSEAGGGYLAGPDIVGHLEVNAQLSIQMAGQEFLAIWPATIRPPRAFANGSGGLWSPGTPAPVVQPPAPPGATEEDEVKGVEPPPIDIPPPIDEPTVDPLKVPERAGTARRVTLIATATFAAVVAALWFFGKTPPPEFASLDPAIAAVQPDNSVPPKPSADAPINQLPPPLLAALPAPDATPPTDNAPAQAPSDAYVLQLGLQNQLHAHGCAPGVRDGEYGEKSVRAAEVFNRLAPESCGDLQPLGSMRDAVPDANWIERAQHNWQVLQSCVPQTACGGQAPEGFAREMSRGCLYDPTVHSVVAPGKFIDGGGTAEWTGDCVDGFVSGNGTLKFAYQTSGVPQDYRQSWTGVFLKGRPHAGTHVVTELNNRIWRRPLDAQGKLNGKGSIEHASGLVEAGRYENNRMVGSWTVKGRLGDLTANLNWDGSLVGGTHAVYLPEPNGRYRQYSGGVGLQRAPDGNLEIWLQGTGRLLFYEDNQVTGIRSCVWDRNRCVRRLN